MNAAQPARYAYREWLVRAMADDPRLVCLDTDTGLFAGVDFGASAERYINLGIAEQNLMGVAAGMAAAGWVPFANTMASFAANRAAEAVKIDIAYNALPVRIVGTHGGFAAGHFGPTHHALDDLAFMRALPNMTVVVPGDVTALGSLLDQVRDLPGPAYVRLGRKADPPRPAPAGRPVVGRLESLRPGSAVVVVAVGPLPVLRSLEAADLLAAGGLRVGVLEAHTLKPFDAATLLERIEGSTLVVTVEEHWRTGGLGSLVSEVVAESAPCQVVRLGVPDEFAATVGSQQELLDRAGVSAAGIAAAVRRALEDRRPRRRGEDQWAAVPSVRPW